MPATILFADDYADARELAEVALTTLGFHVLLAGNGAEAVAIAEAHRPDLIAMDIFMPELDGIEAARRLKAGPLARIPVIACTAKPSAVAGVEHLFAAVCAKPCPPDRLAAIIREVLGADRAAPWPAESGG